MRIRTLSHADLVEIVRMYLSVSEPEIFDGGRVTMTFQTKHVDGKLMLWVEIDRLEVVDGEKKP